MAPRFHALRSALGLLILLGAARAQQFVELPHKLPLPPADYATLAIVPGDVNGDGRSDLFLCNTYSEFLGTDGRNSLQLGLGKGTFLDASAGIPQSKHTTYAAAFLDADGDRDLDLVVGNFSGSDELWLNDGRGRFSDASARIPKDSEVTFSVVVFDADGDGDTDVLLGNSGPNRLYANDGRGTFSDVSAASRGTRASRSLWARPTWTGTGTWTCSRATTA